MSLKALFSKKKKTDIPKCICGERLLKTTPNAFSTQKLCDGCYKECKGNEVIYTCPTQTGSVSVHAHGYDICDKCAQNNYVPSSNTTSFMTLRQMGFGWDESLLALELVDGDIDKATKILKNFKSKSDANHDYKTLYDKEHNQLLCIQQKYQRLQSELGASKIQVSELFDTANKADQYETLCQQQQLKNIKLNDELQSLQRKNEQLESQLSSAKDEINQLLDDKKEMELLIKEMKKENESLKKRNVEPSDFLNWNYEQILLWIMSIDGGHFNKYFEFLKKELTDCQMKGSDLLQLNTNDIRGLGIKVFSDAKKLENCIQELLNKYGDNSKTAVSVENEGQHDSTAYI